MTAQEKKLAELNGTAAMDYAHRVHVLLRKKYSQSAVEAILNNYLDDPDNAEHRAEFEALQAYRKECKQQAKTGAEEVV